MINEDFEELDFIQPHKIVGKLISVEVLDKIIAEIEKKHDRARGFGEVLQMNAFSTCLEIIDKYKAESEDKE